MQMHNVNVRRKKIGPTGDNDAISATYAQLFRAAFLFFIYIRRRSEFRLEPFDRGQRHTPYSARSKQQF